MRSGRNASETRPIPKPASPWTKQAAAMTSAPTAHVSDNGTSDNGARLELGRPAGQPMPADGGARPGVLEESDDDVARVGRIDHVVDEVPARRAVWQCVELPLGEKRLATPRALPGRELRQLR